MTNYLLIGLLTVYILWTLNFVIKFNRTDKFFNKGQKIFHNILIWAIPFVWIIILKNITKPTPGSHNFKKTKDKRTKDKSPFYESGIGIWGFDDGHRDQHHNDGGHSGHEDD